MKNTKNRYLLLDGIRGIAIVNMVLYHFLYDVFELYGKDPGWTGRLPVFIWQQFICWTFILVSGAAWHFGKKSNLRRGIMLNVVGVVITLVTWIAVPGGAVWFGILNFLGCGILLLIPLDRVLKRVPPAAGMAVSFLLFWIFRRVQSGVLSLGDIEFLRLPSWLYESKVFTPFGFPYPEFSSADYFPILPWIFLLLVGYFFGIMFLKKETWKEIGRKPVPLLSRIGQKSIWIYVIHQPVCMLVCMLLFG